MKVGVRTSVLLEAGEKRKRSVLTMSYSQRFESFGVQDLNSPQLPNYQLPFDLFHGSND
jgi:hypothetical protein